MPSIKSSLTFLLSQVLLATANPVELEKRQCPGIHVFGARETTVPPGYGSSATVVNLIINAHSGTTAEAINYPACGGQASCGGISYANSVVAGINAVVTAVNNYHNQCPNTKLVLVGYSQVRISQGSFILVVNAQKIYQGGQIMDNALCGGGDPSQGYPNTAVPLSAGAVSAIRAAIFMGDPRYVHGLPYNVGTCATQGVRILLKRASEIRLLTLLFFISSIPVRSASTVLMRPRSSLTAMPQTHTAATETTRILTKAMARSIASKPSLLSTVSSRKIQFIGTGYYGDASDLFDGRVNMVIPPRLFSGR